ncbi:DNRLRE domain-containing protein [Archangium gephyra]|nr:DNRLRE domain-containing protein [Archangium gephyra]
MHRVHHRKQSLRSLVLPPLMLGLATACGAGGEPGEGTPRTLLTRPSPLSSAPIPNRVVLEPEADTYVWASLPGTNYGTSTAMSVETTSSFSYLRFNLHGIPAGARIASVMLQAVSFDGWAHGGNGNVYTYLVPNDTWSETGMHWYNQPAVSGTDLGSWWLWYANDKPVQVGVNFSPKLRAPVQQALDSDGLISFRLNSPGYKTRYYSREHTVADQRPKLIVTWFDSSSQAVFEPEADAHVDAAQPDVNFGTGETLTADSDNHAAYLRFNLGSIPAGARVSWSTLRATGYSGPDSTGDWSVHTYLVPDDSWSETGLTWNTRPSDLDSEGNPAPALGSWWLEFSGNPPLEQSVSNSSQMLIAPVQDALDSDGFISFRLSAVSSVTNYRSREYPDASARPALSVRYSYPPVWSSLQAAAIFPTADAHVVPGSPTTNFGTQQSMLVNQGSAETFLRFSLANLPANARIAAVSLVATAHSGYAYGGDGNVYTHLVPNDTWSETGITWNNKPAISGGELGSWFVRYDADKYAIQMGINSSPKLVSPVQQALETDGLISFRLSSPGFLTRYWSREYTNTEAHWPTLLVYYYLPV